MKWDGGGDTDAASFWEALRGSPLQSEADAIYEAGRPYTRLLYAQARIESDLGRSDLARTKRNFLGQRPRGGDGFKAFGSFAECAAYYHDKLTDPDYAYRDVETVEGFVHTYAPVSDNNDEADYVRRIGDYAALLPKIGATVTEFTTSIPGLPGGPLVTSYPIRLNLTAVDGFQRPGTRAHTPRRSIQHGTANPNNESAWQEAQYFANGAEGRQASVHSFADDHEIVIGVPLDEIAWQAGDGSGTGNLNGFANEMMEATAIWNDHARRDRMIHIAADFMGRCAARLDVHKPERHWDANWVECCNQPCDVQCGDRHHCPNLLMNTGLWETAYVPQWNAARIDELRRMGGGTTTPAYAKPRPPKLHGNKPYPHVDANGATWLILTPRRWKAIEPAPRKQYAADDAPDVGQPIGDGDTGTFIYSVAPKSGGVWFVSKAGSRCRADAFVPAE